MNKEKAQVATEYLLITGFILIIVTIIFSYVYISNNQNIKISQANTSLDKMINAADIVYALGPGNVQYVKVIFPQGIRSIQDITICESGAQEHNQVCVAPDVVKFGAIEMEIELLGGNRTIKRGAKAELELDGTIPAGERIEAITGVQRIKVEWCDSTIDNKICLKKA